MCLSSHDCAHLLDEQHVVRPLLLPSLVGAPLYLEAVDDFLLFISQLPTVGVHLDLSCHVVDVQVVKDACCSHNYLVGMIFRVDVELSVVVEVDRNCLNAYLNVF